MSKKKEDLKKETMSAEWKKLYELIAKKVGK
jgi:hypothetical protein